MACAQTVMAYIVMACIVIMAYIVMAYMVIACGKRTSFGLCTDSYGLYSYGTYRYGLYSDGLYRYGLWQADVLWPVHRHVWVARAETVD